jgi:Predicted GTPases
MSLNETPSGERTHIGFFGARNAGKSSLVNAVTGQELAVVSDVKGTTTDPVRKAMELLPLGPVVIIDTPGFDDEGKLGQERVKKTREILRTCDIAVRGDGRILRPGQGGPGTAGPDQGARHSVSHRLEQDGPGKDSVHSGRRGGGQQPEAYRNRSV